MKVFFSILCTLMTVTTAHAAGKENMLRTPASAKAVVASGNSARKLFVALLESGAEFNKLPNGSDEIYAYQISFAPFSEEGANNSLVKVEISQDRREVKQKAGSAQQLWQALSDIYPKGLKLNGKQAFGPVICSRLPVESETTSYDPSDTFKAIYTESETAAKLYGCKIDRK